jgi:hypothetical protein
MADKKRRGPPKFLTAKVAKFGHTYPYINYNLYMVEGGRGNIMHEAQAFLLSSYRAPPLSGKVH